MKEKHQEIRLLKRMELLLQKTDDLHALSANEIRSRLSSIGIS